jgi:hypothetical protein
VPDTLARRPTPTLCVSHVALQDMFREHSELFVKQTKKGCVQELCLWEATNEFQIFPNAEKAKDPSNQFMV